MKVDIQSDYINVKVVTYINTYYQYIWQNTFSAIWNLQTNSFIIYLPTSGPTYRRQVVNPRHQTPRGHRFTNPEIKKSSFNLLSVHHFSVGSCDLFPIFFRWLPLHGPLARYVELRFAHAPGMPGRFSPPPRVNYPDMHHGTCATHVPWCMSGSLTSGFLWSRWRGQTFPAFPAHAQPAILRIW